MMDWYQLKIPLFTTPKILPFSFLPIKGVFLDLETISIGYIILNNGKKTSVEIIRGTDGLPMTNHDIVLAHALASQYMGHKMIYLECGSDSDKYIDINLLKKIKKNIEIKGIIFKYMASCGINLIFRFNQYRPKSTIIIAEKIN